MTTADWLISFCALAWLAVMWAYERTQNKKLPPVWILLTFLVVGAYRVVSGKSIILVVAAVVVLLLAERKHLQSRLLETVIALAGILAIGWMLFTTGISTAYGIVGVLVFWFSWELHAISGEEAILLLACQMLFPGIEFILACLVVVMGWALLVRIRKGGWLKSHPIPVLAT